MTVTYNIGHVTFLRNIKLKDEAITPCKIAKIASNMATMFQMKVQRLFQEVNLKRNTK